MQKKGQIENDNWLWAEKDDGWWWCSQKSKIMGTNNEEKLCVIGYGGRMHFWQLSLLRRHATARPAPPAPTATCGLPRPLPLLSPAPPTTVLPSSSFSLILIASQINLIPNNDNLNIKVLKNKVLNLGCNDWIQFRKNLAFKL